jgi:hypothetical protein
MNIGVNFPGEIRGNLTLNFFKLADENISNIRNLQDSLSQKKIELLVSYIF